MAFPLKYLRTPGYEVLLYMAMSVPVWSPVPSRRMVPLGGTWMWT